jgi:hypothetical protein
MALSLASYTPLIDYDVELGTGSAGLWEDQSGNGYHAFQATVGQQMAVTASVFNGLPAFRCVNASNTNWHLPSFSLGGSTAAEAFVVFANDADPSAAGGGIWHLGTSTTPYGSHHPWTNGYFYDDFFSTTRKDAIAGVNQSMRRSTVRPLAHVYNVASTSGLWFCCLDAQGIGYTTSNTFSQPALSATLGAGAYVNDGTYALQGYLARFVLFPRILSDSERYAVTADLMTYYGAYRAASTSSLRSTVISDGWVMTVESGSFELNSGSVFSTPLNFSSQMTSGTITSADVREDVSPMSYNTHSDPFNTTPPKTYLMAGKGQSGVIHYWPVAANPDFTAAQYQGGDTPLTDIYVSAVW